MDAAPEHRPAIAGTYEPEYLCAPQKRRADVAEDDYSTSSPTGSPTAPNLRVETLASIRSLTARVGGSGSARCSEVVTGSSRRSSGDRALVRSRR